MNTSAETRPGEPTPSVGHAPRVFRLPLATRLLSLFGVVFFCAATAAGMVLAALVFSTQQWALSLFVLAVAGVMGALTGYVWRDLRGKWSLCVVLDADAARLDLPADRSLIHRPPAAHLTIPYADIAAIEARYEAYGSLGMEMMQRAYVLQRKGGEPVFLFEERAQATALGSSMFADVVTELAARAGITVRDLGMVEGKGGLLGAWGTQAPDWAAPALPRDRAARLWRRAASTGALAISLAILAILIMQYGRH